MKREQLHKATTAVCCALLWVLPMLAQQTATVKTVTPPDYAKWGKLRQERISKKGTWVSYTVAYNAGDDTLFVGKTANKQKYSFPKGNNGQFAGERWFACNAGPKGIVLADLKSGDRVSFPHVTAWQFIGTSKMVMASDSSGITKLEIRDLPTGKTEWLSNTTSFSVAPSGTHVTFQMREATKTNAALWDVGSNKSTVMASMEKEVCSAWTWSASGAAVAFFGKENDAYATLYHYQLDKAKMMTCHSEQVLASSQQETAPWGIMALSMSPKGDKVYFGVREKQTEKEPEIVQRWNGSDTWIYPMWGGLPKNWNSVPKLAVWWPHTEKIRQISSDSLPVVMLDGEQRFALAHNPAAKKWEDTETGKPDWWVTDTSGQGFESLLSSHSADQNEMSVAPYGSRIAYFRQGSWWVWDLQAKWEKKVSAQIPHALSGEGRHGGTEVFGVAGWTADGKSILLYDEFDVWIVNIGNNAAQRLTQGREKKTRFRVEHLAKESVPIQNFYGTYGRTIDTQNSIAFTSWNIDTGESGWWLWKKQTGMRKQAQGNAFYSQLVKAEQAEVYAYIVENFETPPALMVQFPDHDAILLHQSNPHHVQYTYGRSELIKYNDGKGNLLSGALFYPAGFQETKTYPMIVNIYEKMAQYKNRYVNPSWYNGDGVNIANLVTQGYFVLLPDIAYELGDPGISATICVNAAVDRALQVAPIDPKRLALVGHSFGGYETNFIITQTDRFAAAVAGAGASDLQSWYLTVGWDSGTPEAWRFEDQQWRMGKSLFEDPEGYARNSPVVHAKKVNTPLLAWTGEEDRQVNWQQSIEYYLALKKLDKKQILLIYPNESHELMSKMAQHDLTSRIEDWFRHFLKDSEAAPWIREGVR